MKSIFIILSIIIAINAEVIFLPSENNFLQKAAGGSEVKIVTNCQDGNTFVNSRAISSPKTISKGEKITLKAVGTSFKDLNIERVEVEAFLNGKSSFTDKKEIASGKVTPGNDFFYDYETTVPTFVPSGLFEIKVYVVSQNERVGCLSASFTN